MYSKLLVKGLEERVDPIFIEIKLRKKKLLLG